MVYEGFPIHSFSHKLLCTPQALLSSSVTDSTGSLIQFTVRFWKVTHAMLVQTSLDVACHKPSGNSSVSYNNFSHPGLKHTVYIPTFSWRGTVLCNLSSCSPGISLPFTSKKCLINLISSQEILHIWALWTTCSYVCICCIIKKPLCKETQIPCC